MRRKPWRSPGGSPPVPATTSRSGRSRRYERGVRGQVTAVSSPAGQAAEQALRSSWGRLLALLARLLGSLDLAEESLQDAFAAAVTAWERDGVPGRPEAWLLTAARRKAMDRLRREATLARKLPLLVVPESEPSHADLDEGNEVTEVTTIPDERLRLLFTCCHPALSIQARVALTLRLL